MGPDHHEPPRRFTDQTAQYLKKQGYGFGGDGKPDWKWTDPSVNELRVKQDGPGGQFLELKYLGSGSEDFYVAHPGWGADPHVTITFDVEVTAEISVCPTDVSPASNVPLGELPLVVESAVVQLHNAQVNSTHSFDTSSIVNLIDAWSFDKTSEANLALAAAGYNNALVAEGNRGFALLSFAIDGNSSVNFYVSQSTERSMNLQVLGWQAPIPYASQYSPESLALVQTTGPTSGTWPIYLSDPASVQSGRYVPIAIGIFRSRLPPVVHHLKIGRVGNKDVLIRDNGQVIDPTKDNPTFWTEFYDSSPEEQWMILTKTITAPPGIPYGWIAEWHLTFDLATGAITGDATGSAGQKLQVSDSSGDAISFQLSAQ